ncbi:protein sip5 [Anaeramoeba flamelloides]|uniref:Protein sip5 n=1 Tax=Anaeramoeba flamelloides TaxID=1746091 RepID=A0ABQ8Z6S4_9EUKA|nr:protein sip5 [Anaeramoeba flamelloides]
MNNNSKNKLKKHIQESKFNLHSPTFEIYETIFYNEQTVKKMIEEEKLAPIFFPEMDPTECAQEECSICFNYFPILNRNSCCSKGICTECFLQICPNIIGNSNDRCPFCRQSNFKVNYSLSDFILNKEKENLESENFLEMVVESRKKERETFQNEHDLIMKKLLEIKRQEIKNGCYNDLINHDNQKNQFRQKEKEMFMQIRNNQN